MKRQKQHPQRLAIESIRRDGGTQPRVAKDFDTVYEYADSMSSGVSFPPVTVFYEGAVSWLADGFHRVEAAQSIELQQIEAEVIQGTLADAQWYSFAANQSHGLRRTNEDKQRAVKAALSHPKCAGLSNCQIATHVGVDEKTIRVWKEKLSSELPKIATSTRTVTRNGTTYEQNVSNIGRKPEPQPPPAPMPSSSNSAEFVALANLECAIKTEIRKLQAFRNETAKAMEELLSQLPTIIQSGDQVAIVSICSTVAECKALIEKIEAHLPPTEVLDRIAREAAHP